MSFWGYCRADGSAGTRNYVGVISTVTCANDVAQWIVERVPGCALFTHQQGCGQHHGSAEEQGNVAGHYNSARGQPDQLVIDETQHDTDENGFCNHIQVLFR